MALQATYLEILVRGVSGTVPINANSFIPIFNVSSLQLAQLLLNNRTNGNEISVDTKY
jgi:hypothetical protein